ncbi:MAG: HEAT repeat domain-containing protein [Ignavibacteriales bacterium]|nr:HEAT repeat domain-containing protein [Ignavibacteriales bacterium]
MKKEEYKELMYLSVYRDLTEEEQRQLDAYLKKHPELKKELQEIKKFRSFVSDNTSDRTSDDLLREARTQLRTEIRKEKTKSSLISKILEPAVEIFQPKFALGGIGVLSLGVLIGYCSFSSTPDMTRIDNIRFIDSDASDGEIEFQFEAVAPMRLKGKVDDPEIQKVLTHALLNESNAGVRLKTVNAISQQTHEKQSSDPTIKSALITTIKSDQNPGVRREALRVLQQFEFDNEIRDAILHVLVKDVNSGMRVAAINALEMARMDGQKFDDHTVAALKKQIMNEQNNYIRHRAANLVKEIYQ